jgi:MFS family permease
VDPSPRDSRLLVWAIVASQFGPPFMFSGVAVALPHLGAELGAGASALGLVETLFLGGSLAALLPVGRLADATDKRTLYKVGLVGFALACLVVGLLSSVPAILFIRFVQGVTSALVAVAGPAILADVVPQGRRGRAYGASLGAIYAGLSLGPVLAGAIIERWGWRAVFFFGAALVGAGALLILKMLPSKWHRPVRLPRFTSALLWVPAVLCLVLGSALLREGSWAWAAVGGGLALGVAFVWVQRRLREPLFDVGQLAANHVLRNALGVQTLVYLNAFSSVFMLSLYMQVSLGHPPRTAGGVLAVGFLLMAVLAPFAGRLADRYPPRVLSSLGVAAVLAAAVLALSLGERSSLARVVAVLAIQGVGFAVFSSPNMTVIMGSVPSNATSMASAFAAKSRGVGMLCGMLLTTVLISLWLGSDPVEQHPRVLIRVVVTMFSVLSLLAAVALVLTWVTQRSAPPVRHPPPPGEQPGAAGGELEASPPKR